MSAVTQSAALEGRVAGALPRLLQAWRSITRTELLVALGVGHGIGLVGVLTSIEIVLGEDRLSLASWLLVSGLMPLLGSLIALLCWVAADRSPAEGLRRWARLGIALAVTAFLSAWVVRPLIFELPLMEREWERQQESMKRKGEHKVVDEMQFMQVRETLGVLVFGGLGFLLVEVRRRRRLSNEALATILHQRAALSRRVFESRLAAMQAQVEPQFLFNTLVDVEAHYERDAKGAARILDDLITYLRVALPRLRETGATAGTHLAEEIDLVRAYLEVVAARHQGRPQVRFAVETECARARFYPMLLLPLVQRGVRGTTQDEPPPADRVEITAKRARDDVLIAVRVHAAGLCDEHPELARVRGRLDGLYGGRATLHCGEPKPGITDFKLKIPFQPD
jgi:hypothetical protein